MTTSDTHATASAETPEVQEAINKVRPLNATQAKALRTLVQQDFEVVERDMHALYRAEDAAVRERIMDEFKDKGMDADAFVTDAMELITSFEEALRRLAEEGRKKGVALSTHVNRGYSIRQHVKAETAGRDEAINKAVQETRRNYDRALNELHRNQTNVERRILVAQVTGDAEGLLNSLPTASALMLSSAAETAQQLGRQQITG